ncbi:C-GCAxxG-C-C family protein [bacterium]|nr:C-GCAxxG-C-C family protein [bacterium]
MKRADEAVALLDEGYNCAQSVLAAFADTLDLDLETALRLADPFGGGMMMSGGPCGAVTGALLVLGLGHGGTAADDDESNERVRELTREFHRRFRARRGTASCTELLGADISRPEVFAQAQTDEIFADTCPDSVRAAAEILVDML